ncbi:SOS response-associated peptidase [Legionella jamestowniensis]|uniref:SOS response-associated peptidase n=1 Tax=Legionella jamestowniensis TaxID=455 RepID=UPI0008E507BE|nr:SOS response-associated peptidase [Legionella jamestowniensis]SFM07804.1 Putative SOS response-associated peptidase YedK [Legionella jamestowniensis DSM 19215]
MCGRFTIDTDYETIKEQFGIHQIEPLPNSFNVAPTETTLCLMITNEGLEAVQMRWGIVPWYAKEKKNALLINARAETAGEKPAFRQSLRYRRCIMLMSGFFEWQHHQAQEKTIKQPYYITRADKKLMAVAAIWEKFKPEPEIIIPSCCVLTTTPNELVSKLHDRMPWILTNEQLQDWLAPSEFTQGDLNDVMHHDKKIELICYPVTPAVNSALYKEKDAILPLQNV